MKAAAFWDSSALIPLCIDQETTPVARELNEQFEVVVWWAAPVEMASAFARLLRMKDIDEHQLFDANRCMEELRIDWAEIEPTPSLRQLAESFPTRFGLRAADSLQLAAAAIWTMHHPAGRPFLSGDQRLLAAAADLGFRTIAL